MTQQDNPGGSQRISVVEPYGVAQIPPEARTSSAFDVFRIVYGGGATFATVLLGTFPIALGLSLQAAIWSAVIGTLAGGAILAPMVLFGPRNGTNNAVSSGAHFGVRGRLIGSFLSLLSAVTFFALAIWVSGDAFVGGAHRLLHLPVNDGTRAVVYAVLSILVIIVCVYGFQMMLMLNKITTVGATLIMVIGCFALSSKLHLNYGGDSSYFLNGSFAASFATAILIAASSPISFGAFLGDWARYIPENASKPKLLWWSFAASLALILPFVFGEVTATIVPDLVDYASGLVQVSPLWYAVPLLLTAFFGGLATGSTSLYGTGLDFSSVFPRLNRVQSTLLIGVVSLAIVMICRFGFSLVSSVNALLTVIVVCTTPWMAIMTIGYVVRRGHYSPDDLQVFNRGQRGGRYWFASGVEPRGLIAWVVAAGVGIQFANVPPLFEGPARNVFGGVDTSLPITLVLGAVLYVAFLVLFPEPGYVYGPDGPRFLRNRPAQVPAVVDDPRASMHRVSVRDSTGSEPTHQTVE